MTTAPLTTDPIIADPVATARVATDPFAHDLLAWYDTCGRDLPWRHDCDAWAVLVSEVMLQQTQVSRVLERWRPFLQRWPTPAALAAVPLADVLVAWQGLGYHRRAKALHETARAVVERHDGSLPTELQALLRLPGVGPYTARAVLAFAHDLPAAPVDVNIGRVLARAVAGTPLSTGAAQRLADERCVAASPRRWSSALMDLGALVCTSRRPACERCPVAESCAWRREGGPDLGPDPAATSAGRARPQGVFEGSDRWHRGRLLDALRGAPVAVEEAAGAARLAGDDARLERIVGGLLRDGLVERSQDVLRLAGSAHAQRVA